MSSWLLLNIGNTHTSWALAQPGVIRVFARHLTAAFLEPDWELPEIPAADVSSVVAACVVPDAGAVVEAALDLPLHWLHEGTARLCGLDFGGVDASTVGADRLANAITAIHELTLPALVLDCGTAIASVIIDADRKLRGGFILPGRQLQRLALRDHTGLLPVVPLAHQVPEAIGQSTPACIRAGIDLGVPGAVERLLQVVRRELGDTPLHAVAIGGDREYLVDQVPGLSLGAADFTLRGLRHVAACVDPLPR